MKLVDIIETCEDERPGPFGYRHIGLATGEDEQGKWFLLGYSAGDFIHMTVTVYDPETKKSFPSEEVIAYRKEDKARADMVKLKARAICIYDLERKREKTPTIAKVLGRVKS